MSLSTDILPIATGNTTFINDNQETLRKKFIDTLENEQKNIYDLCLLIQEYFNSTLVPDTYEFKDSNNKCKKNGIVETQNFYTKEFIRTVFKFKSECVDIILEDFEQYKTAQTAIMQGEPNDQTQAYVDALKEVRWASNHINYCTQLIKDFCTYSFVSTEIMNLLAYNLMCIDE